MYFTNAEVNGCSFFDVDVETMFQQLPTSISVLRPAINESEAERVSGWPRTGARSGAEA